MLSRALTLATVMLLIGCLAADKAQAQATNLEAGKSPSQIFAGTCNACHKSPRGLLKTVPAGSLPTFLRQHYTTSPEMAGVLASFLISNGATDTRYSGGQPKGAKEGAKEAIQEAKPSSPSEPPGPKRSSGKPQNPKQMDLRRRPNLGVPATASDWRGQANPRTAPSRVQRVSLPPTPRTIAALTAADRPPNSG